MPEIWRRLEAVGLHTTEACGDCPRVILGSPVAGIAADEIIDPTPAIRDIADRYIGDPQYSNLPRKFKTAITGHPLHDVVPEVNDIAFVGVEHPELRPRLRPVGRRRAVHQPDAGRPARRLGARGGGRRGLGRGGRALPRLRLPAAADPGPDQVPGRRLGSGEVPRGAGDRVPEAPADRRPGPGDPGPARRPRRGQPAEGRPVLRRSVRGGRPGQRQPPGQAGRPGRGARVDPAAHHADAEDPGARRRPATRSTRWSPAPRRSVCRPGRTPGGAR